VIRAMNYFPACHREKRGDVAIQLIDCSRGLPQSPRLLRNDKRGEFIYRAGANAEPFGDQGNELFSRLSSREAKRRGDPADRLLPWIAAVAKAPSQ
jgi:hypothetical protein